MRQASRKVSLCKRRTAPLRVRTGSGCQEVTVAGAATPNGRLKSLRQSSPLLRLSRESRSWLHGRCSDAGFRSEGFRLAGRGNLPEVRLKKQQLVRMPPMVDQESVITLCQLLKFRLVYLKSPKGERLNYAVISITSEI